MALFDFPRIHFSGNVDLNVPTLNNAVYFPLALYDQTRSVGFLPPRLYFSSEAVIRQVPNPIPDLSIHQDNLNNYWYIDIEPIDTIDRLRDWCTKQLGTYSLDAAYIPYYKAAEKDLAPRPIMGNCPGYWNMYGDMGVSLRAVNVTGVQTFDGSEVITWTNESSTTPAPIQTLLRASFDLDTVPGNGTTSACIVETISSQSVYASVFCNTANLFDRNSGEVYFTGGHFRFAALIYSAFRVINWMPPMGGSSRFCTSISLDKLDEPEQMALIRFFNSNKSYDNRPLKGVFVTFTVLEVFDNRQDQDYYKNNGFKPNPARATTVGSLTPWYEGDMSHGVIGRQLTSFQPGINKIYTSTFYGTDKAMLMFMAPVTVALKELADGKAIFSVDMGHSWPEMMTPAVSFPTDRDQATFESANLGQMGFCYGSDPSSVFASISISPTANSRASVFTKGCLFDFVLTDSALIDRVKNNFLEVCLKTPGANLLILKETDYMICSDQKGMYAEQGDLPSGGYQVNTNNHEPCTIRIFQKGVPVTTPIALVVGEYAMPEAGNDPTKGTSQVKTLQLADNDVVDLSAFQPTLDYSAIYYFTYPNQYANNKLPFFVLANYTVMDTGSFMCLRVHPAKDYSQYLDPLHPNYTPPDFAVVYREIFGLYDIVYPVMARIHAFTKEVWETPLMLDLVGKYTNPKRWTNMDYMPRSRELSVCQYNLLQAWIKNAKSKRNAGH